MTKVIVLSAIAVTAFMGASALADHHKEKTEAGFISLFDGKSLDGWKVSENQETARVEDGAIVTQGKRAHVFYVGEVNGAKFDDFELRLDVLSKANSNGGVYIHTEYQEKGWPAKGYEIQVNNTHKDFRKTGGLYGIVDNEKPFKDEVWMRYRIRVVGQKISVWVDETLVSELVEEPNAERPPGMEQRFLIDGGGAIALQGHDPGSTVYYKNIRIKPLG